MSMFPTANSVIVKNEDGEPIGWDTHYGDEDEIDVDDFYEQDFFDEDDLDDGTEHPLVDRIFDVENGCAGRVRAVIGDEVWYTLIGDDTRHTIDQSDIKTWFDDDNGGHCPYFDDDVSKFCWDCGQTR